MTISDEIKEILEEIFLDHGETFLKCVIANCASGEGKEFKISQECVDHLIDFIEEKRLRELDRKEKEEIEQMLRLDEKKLKYHFAIIRRIPPEWVDRMSLIEVLLKCVEENPMKPKPDYFGHLKNPQPTGFFGVKR